MKFNLLIITLFIFSVSKAQIKKGNLFIGGYVYLGISNASSTNANGDISKNSYVGFSPSVGWVTKDNLVLGASIITNFNYNSVTNSNNYFRSNRIGAGVWMRKYLPIGKSFYLFGNGMLSAQSLYNSDNMPTQSNLFVEKGYSIDVILVPGIAYQVNKHLFLDAALNNLFSLGYDRKNTEYESSGSPRIKRVINSFNLSSGIGSGTPLQVGIRWMIARK